MNTKETKDMLRDGFGLLECLEKSEHLPRAWDGIYSLLLSWISEHGSKPEAWPVLRQVRKYMGYIPEVAPPYKVEINFLIYWHHPSSFN